MNSEFLFDCIGFIDDSIVLETADVIETKKSKRGHKKLISLVLIAAMLSILLAACGYAVYRASMNHRKLSPDDAMNYYLKRTMQDDEYLQLNHGDCALALHFDTEKSGLAHAFTVEYKGNSDFFFTGYTGTNSVWVFFHIFSQDDYVKSPHCSPEEALKKSGLTNEDAKAMYRNAGFVRADDLDGEEIRVVIYDSPQLAKADLILGWPEGTAQLVCEDTWMEYQRLEVIVDRQWDSGRHDVNKHMFLFHPTEQYLLSFSARDESFSFEDLRQVAERLEPISLDFEYELRRDNVNFSIADHGSG